MNVKILNKKGFVLIGTYIVVTALSVLATAFFFRIANDNLNIRRQQSNIESKCAADAGLNLARYEISHSLNWVTHTVKADGLLVPTGTVPTVTLSGLTAIDEDPESPTYGCYISKGSGLGLDFAVKVFKSPSSDDYFIYSKGLSENQGTERIFMSKTISQSLYDYFLFSPSTYYLSSRTWLADGGRMHTNGSFIFQNSVEIFNVSEFSAKDYIQYYAKSWLPYEFIDDFMDETPGCTDCPHETWRSYYKYNHAPWTSANYEPDSGESLETYSGGMFSEYSYENRSYGHVYGDKYNIRNAAQAIWDPDIDPDPPLPDEAPENYADDDRIAWINETRLPNRLEAPYTINKYWSITEAWGFPESEITVKWLNTSFASQAQALSDYTASEPNLAGVIKDYSSGAEYIEPLSVAASNYADAAQDAGIYIGANEDGTEISVQIARVSYPSDASGEVWIGGHLVAEIKTFINTHSMQENIVTEFNFSELLASGNSPGNGLIYSEANIVVDNAEVLPEGGVTWITEKNLHLKGDYNIGDLATDKQPSAAICAMDLYTLSDVFNYPSALPITRFHIEYPYEPNWDLTADPGDRYNWMANLKDNPEAYPPPCDPKEEVCQELEKPPPLTLPIYDGTVANNVDKDYTYNISAIGHRAYEPKVLENWSFYQDVGDLNNTPSNWTQRKRTVLGSKIRISEEDFGNPGQYDNTVARPERTNPGWPSSMGAIGPYAANNEFKYDKSYNETGEYPPEDYVGFTEQIYMEIPLSEFNYYYVKYY